MGVFDEACFCDLLGERLNKEWNEIIEGAKRKQKAKLEELEEKIKAWKDYAPPSFEKITLIRYVEGLPRAFSLEDALKDAREKELGESYMIVYQSKREKTFKILDSLSVHPEDTMESLRVKLGEMYRKCLEEYEEAKSSLVPFIDWDRLRNVGEIAALKKQVC